MRPLKSTMTAGLLAAAAALAITGAAPAAVSASSPGSHFTGSLPDGASWVADLPAQWNGTLLLYSHGFGPLVAQDAPDPGTSAALLARGYALAGSSYDPNGSQWALNSAVRMPSMSAPPLIMFPTAVRMPSMSKNSPGLSGALPPPISFCQTPYSVSAALMPGTSSLLNLTARIASWS